MKLAKKLSEAEIRRIGSQTGGRTIFFGGLLFILFAFATLFGWMPGLPIDTGYVLIGVFMLGIAVPAFVYSFRQVMQARRRVSA